MPDGATPLELAAGEGADDCFLGRMNRKYVKNRVRSTDIYRQVTVGYALAENVFQSFRILSDRVPVVVVEITVLNIRFTSATTSSTFLHSSLRNFSGIVPRSMRFSGTSMYSGQFWMTGSTGARKGAAQRCFWRDFKTLTQKGCHFGSSFCAEELLLVDI